jgi:hypothetical protein
MLLKSECPMIGSKALSCSCPPSEAMVMVTSLPITSKAIWLTTSGMTGLTLPGMIDEPAARSGRLISFSPACGPLESRRRSLQVFRQLAGDALEDARQLHEGACVLRRLDQVVCGNQTDASKFGEEFGGQLGIADIGVDAGADRGGAEVDLLESGDGLVQPRTVFAIITA